MIVPLWRTAARLVALERSRRHGSRCNTYAFDVQHVAQQRLRLNMEGPLANEMSALGVFCNLIFDYMFHNVCVGESFQPAFFKVDVPGADPTCASSVLPIIPTSSSSPAVHRILSLRRALLALLSSRILLAAAGGWCGLLPPSSFHHFSCRVPPQLFCCLPPPLPATRLSLRCRHRQRLHTNPGQPLPSEA